MTPPGDGVTYYFTARDAFHTKTEKRTDFAVNYSSKVTPGSHALEVFFQAQVLSLFNRFQVSNINNIDTTVLTRFQSTRFTAFNPFTTTPVQGVNWDYGSKALGRTLNFGDAVNRNAYTLPRTFRMTFGVRF